MRHSSRDATSDQPALWRLAAVALTTVGAQIAVLACRDVLILEWRPTDLASIALDYYRRGFHFLHPQVFWGGSGTGDVEMEFPLIPYAVARLWALVGLHDWVALVIPMLCGIGLAVVMTIFVTRFFRDATAGLVAGLFVATSPTWLDMSTGLWPDAPPVFAGALGLYLLWRWVHRGGNGRFVAAAAGVSLALLLKLTSAYLGLPVLFLFVLKYRQRWWRAAPVWLFAALVMLPPILWYAHAYGLFLESRNTFGILGSGYSKFATADLLLSPRFYVRTFLRVAVAHTTPLGIALVVVGAARVTGRAADYFFHVWIGAVLIYFLIAAQGVNLGHYQYALPIVPPSAGLAGLGFVLVMRRLATEPPTAGTSSAWTPAAVLCLILAANSAAANYLYESRGTGFRRLSEQKMRTGKAVASLTSPGSLIVVVDADMDDRTPETSMTPPEVFYFADRRGWYRAMAWLSPAAIESLARQGAKYLVVSANHVRYFRTHYTALYDFCRGRYRTLVDDDEAGIVFDMTSAPPDGAGR